MYMHHYKEVKEILKHSKFCTLNPIIGHSCTFVNTLNIEMDVQLNILWISFTSYNMLK